MKTVALITARGGSKGLPGKNVRSFCGKPLISWSIAQALDVVEDVYVSTDCETIAAVAKSHGAKVPFLRSPELATDHAKTIDVCSDFLNRIDVSCDALFVLQPTSPIRRSGDLNNMQRLLEDNWDDTDGVVTFAQMHPSPWLALEKRGEFLQKMKAFREVPRQELPEAFFSYGVAWLTKSTTILSDRTLYPKRLRGLEIQPEQAFDIDYWYDFVAAEAVMTQLLKQDENFLPRNLRT